MSHIDLITGKINLIEPGFDSDSERADMIYLTSLPQWVSLRNWLVRQSVDFFGAAGSAGKDEAYILARLGKYIVDTVNALEHFAPVVEEKVSTDVYADGEVEASSITPGNLPGLPLAPLEE